MTKEEFVKKLTDSVKVGDVFDNPGCGTSTIQRIEDDTITYMRGTHDINLSIDVMYNAFIHFPNGFSSNDLRPYNSQFKNHGCNCTFLMMMLKAMGIVKQIEGSMKPRDLPFRVKIN